MTFVVRAVRTLFMTLFLLGAFAHASNHSFERFADELGGRQSSVYDIFRDDKGFLWFAGDTDGLLRYDGYQLIRWSGQGEDALGRVSYSAVLMSTNERLWAAAWGSGLLLWQAEDHGFQVFNTDNSAIPDNRVQTIFEDQYGTIWAGTLAGLVSISRSNSVEQAPYVIEPLPANSPLAQERIWRLAEFAGSLWVATTSGLYQMSHDGQEWTQFAPYPERLGNNRINEIRTVRVIGERLWLGIDGGLFEFDVERSEFLPVRFPSSTQATTQTLTQPQINTLYPRDDDAFWVGTQNGLLLVDMLRRQYISRSDGDFVSVPDVDIRRIASDTNGSLWLATRDQGILHSQSRANYFQTTAESADEPIRSLVQRSISAVSVAANDDLWLGVPNGVVQRRQESGVWYQWSFPVHSASRRTESIFTDATGRTWIASNSSLYFIEQEDSVMQEASDLLESLGIDATAVTSITEDRNGRLWFGFWGRGLAYYDGIVDGEVSSGWDFTELEDLRGDLIYDLIDIQDSGLWMITRFSGIFHKAEGTSAWVAFDDFASAKGWNHQLPRDGLLCLYFDAKDTLWFCSEQGLFSLELRSGAVHQYTRAQGLPSDRILAIASAPTLSTIGHEGLWLATSRGISLFERQHTQFLNFGLTDGLPAMEFVRGAMSVSSDGRIFAGTVRGAVDFNPQLLEINRTTPKVGLSRLWVDDQDITGRLSFFAPSVALTREHRSIIVQFSVLDFSGAAYNTGRYRLLGLNDEWSAWSELRQLTFTTLPAGQYTLEIEGRNSLGIVAEEPLRIEITVARPWWESGWTWLFGGALLLVLMMLFSQLRFAALARMNRRLDKQVRERTRELEGLALKLREQSHTDYLTKLPNRRAFTEKFDWLIAHAKRHNKPLALVLFDVDHFKRFNDDYGHEAGDQVLIALSELLQSRLREQDVIGRWGGEEFAILLPETPLKGALSVCESLRSALEQMRVEHEGHSLQVTATFGVYEGQTNQTSLDAWMQCADTALYRGKELGRNRVTAYHHDA